MSPAKFIHVPPLYSNALKEIVNVSSVAQVIATELITADTGLSLPTLN